MEQDDDGTIRINRLNYEVCMLQALREKVRVREIWGEGTSVCAFCSICGCVKRKDN